MINSRAKGIRGERELFAILSDELGIPCRRNLEQVRNGGADTLDVAGWSIEVKTVEKLAFGDAWEQACNQAHDRKPVLAWKRSRKPWACYIDLNDLVPDVFPRRGNLCQISVQALCQVIRENAE